MPRMAKKNVRKTAAPAPPPVRAWPANTAGARMTTKVPVVHCDQTVAEAQSLVFHCIKVFKSVDYLYVVDRKEKLYGVLSIKELYARPKEEHVGNLCKRRSLITIKPLAHQEKAVYLAIRNNIKAIPVVGDDKEFLGAIPNDTILTILYHETHEDLMRMAGLHPHAAKGGVLETSLFTLFWHRIPWLFLGLFGGLFTATIIGMFEHTLEQNLILAAFIPMIVYMSDAVGTQMEACIVRDIALDRIRPFALYFLRQMITTLAIAVVISIVMGGAIVLLYGSASVGLVVALSLCASTISSVVSGLLVPYAFSAMHCDPADASGPLATIIQDLLSVTIYFGVANWLL